MGSEIWSKRSEFQIVYHLKLDFFCPDFRSHLNTQPFGICPIPNHLKFGHFRISDPHCTITIRILTCLILWICARMDEILMGFEPSPSLPPTTGEPLALVNPCVLSPLKLLIGFCLSLSASAEFFAFSFSSVSVAMTSLRFWILLLLPVSDDVFPVPVG